MNTLQRDAELVAEVKFLCDRTKRSAAKLAARPNDPDLEIEKEQYLRTKLNVMRTTNRIQDRVYFETAVNALIALCIAANEIQDARRLLTAITIDDIRAAVFHAHPQLGTESER